MILVHYRDGTTSKLYPTEDSDLCALDDPVIQKNIRRIALLDEKGHRTDLPSTKNGTSRVWVELVKTKTEVRGERVCMRRGKSVLSVTMYYSDGRVVVDL